MAFRDAGGDREEINSIDRQNSTTASVQLKGALLDNDLDFQGALMGRTNERTQKHII